LAGWGLSGTPGTGKPAAHRMPARMSESRPPHLPSTRTGSRRAPQVPPAMPALLLVLAAIMPATRVPCQELLLVSQLANSGRFLSALVIQSPGSDGSGSRPLLSFATKKPPFDSPDTKS